MTPDFRPPPAQDPLDDLDEAADVAARTPRSADAFEEARAWSAERAFDALASVSRAVASNLDAATLVRQVLDLAVDSVGAERGVLWLGKGDLDEIAPVAARGFRGDTLAEMERISRTIAERGHDGQLVLSADALHDPGLLDIPSVQLHQIRAVLCLPLSTGGERVGVLYLDHPNANAFPRHTRAFLGAYANLAAVALENARIHGALRRENLRIRRQGNTRDAFGRIVTASATMRELLRMADVVAGADSPLLLLGESGTGKELLARAIHEAGPRALKAFVAFNCAAVPRDLVESLFFGHVRGAFTGAVRDAQGLFVQADGGVLLLDEIAELDAGLQAKLLRVLQDGIVRPVGGERETRVNVRIITATCRNLAEAVRRGHFREDLYYRLAVLELRLPPLRERPGDIPLLVEHFLQKHLDASGPNSAVRFTDDAIRCMQEMPWHGNVRELENFVQRIIVLSGTRVVTEQHVRAQRTPDMRSPEHDAGAHGADPSRPATGGTIADQERAAIVAALARTGGNKTRAAHLLGIHRNSLERRMQRHGIRYAADEPGLVLGRERNRPA